MGETIEIRGKGVVAGKAEGEALVADATLSFWGEVDAVTGKIIAVGHPLEGESLKDRVLVIRSTKGSSALGAWPTSWWLTRTRWRTSRCCTARAPCDSTTRPD